MFPDTYQTLLLINVSRPTLFQDLLTSIDVHTKVFVAAEGSDMRASLILRRSLEVLNAVLKELATVKMPAGVKLYGQVCIYSTHVPFKLN